MVRNTVLAHLDGARDGVTLWSAGLAGYGRLAGNGDNLHHDNAGFLAGLDMPVLSHVTLGVAGGYTSNRARTPGRLSTASGDSGHIGGYADWRHGDLRFDVAGDYGFGSVRIDRAISQLGVAGGRQDPQTGQVFADLGYRIGWDGVVLEPHAAIAHIMATGGAFAEAGSIAALSGAAKSESVTYGQFGMRASLADMALGAGLALTPKLDLGWQHALAPFTPDQTVTYANAGTSFLVRGTPLVEDAGTVQAGFDLRAGGSATLFLSYDGSFSSTVESHGLRGGLNWRF